MRGNHLVLGRQDYVEPPPLGESARRAVAACAVTLASGKKTWFTVHSAGQLLGYVSTRMHGQYYRAPNDADWRYVVGDWDRKDPPHGHAIAALLAAV